MEDGLNYLVDVTNCDEGTVGAPDLLFLAAPASGDPEMGYYFALSNGETVQYFYDSDQQSLYGSSILTLASDNYNSGHLYTITFEWSEDYSSCLAIRCCTECGQTSKVNCEVSVTTEAADCTSEGKEIYTAAAFGSQDTKTVTLPAKGHRAASPVKEHSTAATWQAPASWEEVSYCSVCGAELNRVKKSGKAALTPTYQLTADNLILQTGQKTNVLKVTDLLSGDFVASWTSSNTKIVKVSGTADGSAKVTAGKKTGTATITIRLASKAEITVKVKVQKQKVATKSVKLSSRSITLKKGQKLKLAPVVTPLTSQEKVTYTSSNKKVARVTGSGVISAGKIGTAKITVKSGKKKVVCKVRVTK
jgi:head-tail adaptor